MTAVTMSYTVHSAVVEKTTVTATVNGVAIEGEFPRLVVELVGVGNDHGPTYRFPVVSADELAAQVAKYIPGAAITVTLD